MADTGARTARERLQVLGGGGKPVPTATATGTRGEQQRSVENVRDAGRDAVREHGRVHAVLPECEQRSNRDHEEYRVEYQLQRRTIHDDQQPADRATVQA